jgi:chemosensory pili system protein ChpA (sensor histidine kinase/response regulator)
MDIVRSEITAIGGRVEIRSEAGKGTSFHISLPLTLVVTQAVLITSGRAKYLVPSAMIEQVKQARDAELQALYREGAATSMTGRRVPFFYLPRLLGDPQAQPSDSRVATILFVRTGNAGAALHVETVQGNQEIVVKNTGPMLSRITGVTGATVLGSGEIVLILNPLLLSQRMAAARVEPKVERPASAAPREPQQLTVLVVDDSLTVRRATERLLTREGYNVITARDGVNALEVLQKSMPHVMLVDIEMPRMDGFDLTRNVRADERLKDVPIIMITSRTAEKHRQVAFDLGVSAFLGKPYREDELLHHVRTLVRIGEATA